MNVIIAGEESGTIRDAFARLGHNAWSCDIRPSASKEGNHWVGSWRGIEWPYWDLLIAHPECTHLAVSGARHFPAKQKDGRQQTAIAEFIYLADAPVPMKAIEQPISIMSRLYRKPDQIIQPHQFGHDASKSTCLWLTGLPKLTHTNAIKPRLVCCGSVIDESLGKYGCANCGGENTAKPRWGNQTDSGQNSLAPSLDRWKIRSKTYDGIANAMAAQWGKLC